MSICASAELIYGVLMNEDEEIRFNDHPNHDEIYDYWVYDADLYNGDGDKIIGIKVDSVDEGESTEVCLSDPNVDELLDVLDMLGINKEPTWHLVCALH